MPSTSVRADNSPRVMLLPFSWVWMMNWSELSSYVTTWKRIGLAVESSDPKGILDSADYLEEIGQEYVAWLYRYRAAAFMANASKARVQESAETWANDRGLVLY